MSLSDGHCQSCEGGIAAMDAVAARERLTELSPEWRLEPDGRSIVRDFKFNTVVNAIRENNGNKTVEARALKISRAYLHRLIRLAEPDQIFDQDLQESATG